jgi:hypothetical protein
VGLPGCEKAERASAMQQSSSSTDSTCNACTSSRSRYRSRYDMHGCKLTSSRCYNSCAEVAAHGLGSQCTLQAVSGASRDAGLLTCCNVYITRSPCVVHAI